MRMEMNDYIILGPFAHAPLTMTAHLWFNNMH